MTTPDTSAVRAWARSNGYDVADRGRLPAELTDAYLAAQRSTSAPAKKAAAKKPAAAKAAAKKPATKRTATTAAKPVAKRTAAAPATDSAPVEQAAPAATSSPAPAKVAGPKPKPVEDDRRLVALGEQLNALTARVAELERALGSKPSGNGVAKRFRRSR